MSEPVCLDKFCCCHGHTCDPDPFPAIGAVWRCPECRRTWIGTVAPNPFDFAMDPWKEPVP